MSRRPDPEPVVRLVQWNGPWSDDDPDANFKDEVAAYRLLDPLETLEGASAAMNIPVGALARYVLARWSTGGSEGMLHLGSTTVERMYSLCAEAESADTDTARLDAYEQLRQMIGWLKVPFDQPETY